MRFSAFWVLLTFAVIGGRATATSIPGSLTSENIARLTRYLAMGGSVRLLRSAESYPSWPGIKFGLEVTIVPGSPISGVGDGLGTVAGLLPVPRVYLAKGLFQNTELIFSFFPANLNTLAGVGGILKWTFLPEANNWLSVAGIVGISSINAFQGEFKGVSWETGVVASKDYVRWRPYAGASLMFAQGTVLQSLTAGSPESGTLLGTHFFLGSEFELPFNLAAQLDLYNLDPSIALFVGKRF